MPDVCEELRIKLIERCLVEVLKQEVTDDVRKEGEHAHRDLKTILRKYLRSITFKQNND